MPRICGEEAVRLISAGNCTFSEGCFPLFNCGPRCDISELATDVCPVYWAGEICDMSLVERESSLQIWTLYAYPWSAGIWLIGA
jgi:hypothetical protein